MAINDIGQMNAYQKMASLGLDPTHQKTTQQNTVATQLEAAKVKVSQEMNASMVSHLFGGDNQQSAENGLKMTYQAAIDKLNERFQETFGDKFEEMKISQDNLDKHGIEHWNPQNTAQRIVSGATQFLDGFKAIHPELEGDALMEKYMEVVGGGLQQGFSEAQGILGDLEVFDGLVADKFNSTVNLVERGMENFRREYLGLPALEDPVQAATQQVDSVTATTTEMSIDAKA